MKFSWLHSFLLASVVLFASCEKELNIPIQESEPRLVVDGSIASDQQPGVVLTKTIGFFDKIDLENVQFVNDAEVWVTDVTTNQKIQLFPITFDQLSIYTIQNSDPLFNDFKAGKTNHTYKLEVTADNKYYTAVTTIPACDGFDSLYFEKLDRFAPDSVYKVVGIFTDPDTLGNYYKYFTQRNGNSVTQLDFIEPFSSRFDDVYINGKTLPADIFLGFENSDTVDNEFANRGSYSVLGDTIVVKLSAMDVDVYDFQKTLDFAEGSVGNPFAAPIQVQSNISNDAYGVWAGYGNAYNTIINKE